MIPHSRRSPAQNRPEAVVMRARCGHCCQGFRQVAGGFGGIGTQRGVGAHAERSPRASARVDSVVNARTATKVSRFLDQLPEVWALLRPRRGLLALGFVLMTINRVSGLLLPASQKYLFDNVFGKHQTNLLVPLVVAVLAATLVQGVTSYALTQLLSKAAQRMITELRRKVQEHVGRLPVAYYDSNKTGALVSRIMSDVEGIRNLLGTGLIEFTGGVLTAVVVLVILLKTSLLMTGIAAVVIAGFTLTLRKAFGTIRPIFRERGKINADVTGRLTESLGGVRVVKGYHAESREEKVFAGGVKRLLDNILKTLTATSILGLSSSVLVGLVGAVVMYVGARQILAGSMTL